MPHFTTARNAAEYLNRDAMLTFICLHGPYDRNALDRISDGKTLATIVGQIRRERNI